MASRDSLDVLDLDAVVAGLAPVVDKEGAYAAWPEGQSLNRRYYKPSARERVINIKHVRYEKYPELVVGLDREGRVRSIHSNTEHTRVR